MMLLCASRLVSGVDPELDLGGGHLSNVILFFMWKVS